MKNHLKLELAKALLAYQNGDAETKQFLSDMYGKETFLTNIEDRVTGYETACEVLKRKSKTLSQFEALYDTNDQARRQYARHRLVTVCEALNEGWVPDFENESEWKYYNWMYNKKNGLRLSGSYCDFVSVTGSDLCLKNAKLRDHVAKICKDEYATYLFGY